MGLPIFLASWPIGLLAPCPLASWLIGLLATEFHLDVTDDTNLPESCSLILHLAV